MAIEPIIIMLPAIIATSHAARVFLQEEEEEMADYTDGFEFKILRAQMNIFKDPVQMKKICEEEGQAGWTLFEKLDDRRLRFKRSANAKNNDQNLSFDAYRTSYGTNQSIFLAISIALVVGIVLFGFFLTTATTPKY